MKAPGAKLETALAGILIVTAAIVLYSLFKGVKDFGKNVAPGLGSLGEALTNLLKGLQDLTKAGAKIAGAPNALLKDLEAPKGITFPSETPNVQYDPTKSSIPGYRVPAPGEQLGDPSFYDPLLTKEPLAGW